MVPSTPPLVSVIIPCYRQAEFLPDALNSVLEQTFMDWECIIVNDGSPDDTGDVAKSFCERDVRIRYRCQNNCGIVGARNGGIKESRGKYILPLDADDKIAPTYLEKAVTYMESHNTCKIVSCRVELFGEAYGEFYLPEFCYDNMLWNNCIVSCSLFRRADYDAVQGYDITMQSYRLTCKVPCLIYPKIL